MNIRINPLFGCKNLCDFKIVDDWALEIIPAKIFSRIEESLFRIGINPHILIVVDLESIRADPRLRAEFAPTVPAWVVETLENNWDNVFITKQCPTFRRTSPFGNVSDFVSAAFDLTL